jgi:transposase-like protein
MPEDQVTKKRRAARPVGQIPGVPPDLLDQLMAGYQKPEDLTAPDGLLNQLKKALIERAMQAEMTHHLGYGAGEAPPEQQPNRRNGQSTKTVRTDDGPIDVAVPRDRDGSFEPQLIGKHQRHFNGFDDKIVSMYARGMSVREIQSHLREMYNTEVSPDLISSVTDAVLQELSAWQQRALESVYFIVYLDALVVKIRDRGTVQNKAVYLVVGVGEDGKKDVLGMWIQPTEGAKFWLSILGELRQRGVEDILIICADGLTGMPQAVEAAFPRAIFQTCIVHMVRSSTRLMPWMERRKVCADLREIYTAPDEQHALHALDRFENLWGKRYPMIAKAWRTRWNEVAPFLAFPPELRRAIYTTNTIEALNRILRKNLKTRGALPNEDAAAKLIFLGIQNAGNWGSRHHHWRQAYLQFMIHFGDRVPMLNDC